jgi:hypothetical protein
MKTLTIFLFVFFLSLFNPGRAQKILSDSIKLVEIEKKLDSLIMKFNEVLNSKDCDKLKAKYEKEIKKQTESIRDLTIEKEKLIIINNSLQKKDTLNVSKIKELTNQQLQNGTTISTLNQTVDKLQNNNKSLETYKSSKDKQLESIKKNLKSNLENSKKIDGTYANTIQILLEDDANSKTILNQLSQYLMNQKTINEIDSVMQLKTFADFKNTKEKIESLKIDPTFKGQNTLYSNLKLNLENLTQLIVKYKKWHEELNVEKDDLKFTFKFQDKMINDRSIASINDLFNNYPCLNYYVDRILENRKSYTLPSTN